MSEQLPSIDPNPYASPQTMSFIDSSKQTAPHYELYSLSGIVLATFFGSLLAAGIVVAVDYARLGRLRAATIAATFGVAAQIALLLCVVFVFPNMPKLQIHGPQLIVAYLVAEGFLGRKLTLHYRAGGRAASLWRASGIGLLCLIVNIVSIFGLALWKQATVWKPM